MHFNGNNIKNPSTPSISWPSIFYAQKPEQNRTRTTVTGMWLQNHFMSHHLDRLCEFSRNRFALATLLSLVTFCSIDNDNSLTHRCHYRCLLPLPIERVGDKVSRTACVKQVENKNRKRILNIQQQSQICLFFTFSFWDKKPKAMPKTQKK